MIDNVENWVLMNSPKSILILMRLLVTDLVLLYQFLIVTEIVSMSLKNAKSDTQKLLHAEWILYKTCSESFNQFLLIGWFKSDVRILKNQEESNYKNNTFQNAVKSLLFKVVDEFCLTRSTVYVQSFYKATDKKACNILTAYFSQLSLSHTTILIWLVISCEMWSCLNVLRIIQ